MVFAITSEETLYSIKTLLVLVKQGGGGGCMSAYIYILMHISS